MEDGGGGDDVENLQELEKLRTALATGDITTVVSTISSPDEVPAVVAAAAQTLRRLVHNRRPEIGQAGGVEALLGAMKRNTADASLQNACCQALYSIIDDGTGGSWLPLSPPTH